MRPTHAIKRKRARIRFSIEKKQSNYYAETAIVSTKTREQVGTDELIKSSPALTHTSEIIAQEQIKRMRR